MVSEQCQFFNTIPQGASTGKEWKAIDSRTVKLSLERMFFPLSAMGHLFCGQTLLLFTLAFHLICRLCLIAICAVCDVNVHFEFKLNCH